MDVLHHMAQKKTISEEDLKLVLLTDDVGEAMDHISKYIQANYVVKPRPRRWWFFEKK
jgi:predicted Rossmann-fold nucleotide-binding protein